MAKVAILVPYLDMYEMALPLAGQWPDITPMCVEYTRTDQIRSRARELQEQGCELIVARGVQARIARESVKIPVVEIRITTQELGALFCSLRAELGAVRPRLGLIGFQNMFGDTEQFNDLFQIDLRKYMVTSASELAGAVDQAVAEGCLAVAGGDIVCETAGARGLPCRFLAAGEESLREALSIASLVCYAIDLEKRKSAELDAILDNTFAGMVQIGFAGDVQRVNRSGCNLIGSPPREIVGRSIQDVLPEVDGKIVQAALSQEPEDNTAVIERNQMAVIVNAIPIRVDGVSHGALLTLQEARQIQDMDSRLRLELHQRGYIARHTFSRIVANSAAMRDCIALARRVSRYSAPILIRGEPGTGKELLAQSIHNDSMREKGAFVHLDCSAWQGETLDTLLFGNYTTRRDGAACLAETARNGTLYLSHVDCLPTEMQYKVLRLVQGIFLHNGPNRPEYTDVRVIASTDAALALLVESGQFRRDLYYALCVISLEIPPLRRRPEDVEGWFDGYLAEWEEKYNRHVRLTQGAYRFLREYPWPGNLDEMNNLCERVVLLTEKRNIDENFLEKQLELLALKMPPEPGATVIYRDPKAARLEELLRRFHGNREKVAAELGISKTTLWRYMKKYGVHPEET